MPLVFSKRFVDFFICIEKFKEKVLKMFNEKMLSFGGKGSVIRQIFEESKALQAKIGKENVYDFSLGNPSVAPPKKVGDTFKYVLDNTDSIALHGYTSAQGDLAVRRRIAENLNKRFNTAADENDLYMTCGAAASLTVTLKAICNEGDEVIVLAPFFPEYKVFIENAGATMKVVQTKKDNFGIDLENIKAAITAKTKAIIINSPNNPSGVVFKKEQIVALAELLKKTENTIYIISDEPYRELTYDNIEVPFIPNIYANTVVCYSYSKSLSLPGERIGYIYVSQKAKDAKLLYACVCAAGRSMGYVCAPSLLQAVVKECDMCPPDVASYDKNRKILMENLKRIGFSFINPDGAFYLFVKSMEEDANIFCEKAKKYNLFLVPSDDFGVTGYVRIAYCVSEKTIVDSIPSFEKLYKEYEK